MLRKRTDETDPADWFLLASERLRAADSLWKHEGLTATGIEVLQEASERYLKGYLIAKGWRLLRIHDLVHLLTVAEDYNAAFSQFRGFALGLTEDFFAQHYPGDDLTHVGDNYEQFREDLGRILEVIANDLPQYAGILK